MKKIPLSNSFMSKIIARSLGKERLDVNGGKVVLSPEDRASIEALYGKDFLKRLEEAKVDDDDEASLDLFNAAVEAKTGEVKRALEDEIKKLRATVETLAKEPESKPQSQGKGGSNKGQYSLNMNASHNKAVASVINHGDPLGFAALSSATLDIADINSEFTGVMPPNVKLEILAKRLYQGFNDAKYMTRVQSETDFIATATIMSEVSQQFTPMWTPKGKAKFTPCRIAYRRHKINVPIVPAEIIKSWLTYMYEQGKTMAEMPISKYIIENHILPKAVEDITNSMIGKGKFVDHGPDLKDGDNGPAAKDSMDGYETQLVIGKTDPKCKFNFYKGATDPFKLDNQALLNYVDGFVDAISGLFSNIVTIHCSPEFLKRYKRADFDINGKYTGVENNNSIRFTRFTLVPLESMYNSPILFATPKENFVELVDYSKADSCITKIAESDYTVKVFGEYSLAVGFKVQEAVFAAVPDGYDPATTIKTDDAVDPDKWAHGGAVAAASEETEGA